MVGKRAATDARRWDIRLRCPRCGNAIDALDCAVCGFSIAMDDGIAHALLPESAARLARFIADYERIRTSEGRGSESEAFYLALPYRDTTARDRDQWRMRARSYDYIVRRLLAGSRVLDLGAGNGWMSFRLALAGYQPAAVDLLTNDRDGLGAARHYRTRLPNLFPRFQAEIRRLRSRMGSSTSPCSMPPSTMPRMAKPACAKPALISCRKCSLTKPPPNTAAASGDGC